MRRRVALKVMRHGQWRIQPRRTILEAERIFWREEARRRFLPATATTYLLDDAGRSAWMRRQQRRPPP